VERSRRVVAEEALKENPYTIAYRKTKGTAQVTIGL
tara:strand:- start:584 stop:691 length:108 start_codon:yes stop_codon:yes gene_type:complete